MISIIVAVSSNNVIGIDNKLPWYLPRDLKRFKELTTNHCVIMGRKTYESIGKALPNRTNIVISRAKINDDKIINVNSVQEAIKLAKETNTGEIFIIGGGEIYQQTIDIVDKLYLTVVDSIIEAPNSTKFPEINYKNWHLTEEICMPQLNGLNYSFITYIKHKIDEEKTPTNASDRE